MPQNVELKARLESLTKAERVAREIATERLGTEWQVDTYFVVPHGRLKLREIRRQPHSSDRGRTPAIESQATLIGYVRSDTVAAKLSDYRLIDVPDPVALKETLSAALGVRCVVSKRREIFLHGQVRIHLDAVERLGAFIEFEAVLAPGYDDAAGHAQVSELSRRFEIDGTQRIDVSYVDLLTAKDLLQSGG